jgi:hypothetical protein
MRKMNPTSPQSKTRSARKRPRSGPRVHLHGPGDLHGEALLFLDFLLHVPSRDDLVEVLEEFLASGVAGFGVLLDALVDDVRDGEGGAGCEFSDGRGDLVEVRLEDLGGGLPVEGDAVCQEFVEHDAEGIDVGADFGGSPGNALGRHVIGCAHDAPGVGLASLALFRGGLFCDFLSRLEDLVEVHLGESEIREEYAGGGIEEDVAGFDVAVQDAGTVHVREPLGGLTDDLDGLALLEGAPSLDHALESFPLDVFHRVEDLPRVLVDGIDMDDVRVTRLGDGESFAPETLYEPGFGGEAGS